MTGCPNPKFFIRGRPSGLPSNIQGGSRMRESRTYGSVRGALSNGRPYRNRLLDGGMSFDRDVAKLASQRPASYVAAKINESHSISRLFGVKLAQSTTITLSR